MIRFRAVLGLCALAAACDDGRAQRVLTPATIDECEDLPPLTLTATPASAHVGGVVQLAGSGGAGGYTYALVAGGSGGTLRADRLAVGPTAADDVLTVRDRCGVEASVTVHVTAAFSALPTRARIRPGTTFRIQTDGARTAPVFGVEALGSGGSLASDGSYQAGPQEGLDLITVRDAASGEALLLQYDVATDAAFGGKPARLALPAGAHVPLVTRDGTGVHSWRVLSGAGSVDGDLFHAESTARGTAVLEATDQFTGERARITVQVLDALIRPGTPHGRLTDAAALVTGDFDGDGRADLALGVPESDLARPTGGAVFVYLGSAAGLSDTPSFTLTGATDTAQLGAVLAAGDLDGDGRDDLAIAEPGADVTMSDSGAVRLVGFDASGPHPLRAPLTGLGRASFGAALAIADVDGDGLRDLIVGSPGADLAPSSSISARGVVDLYLAGPGGSLPAQPNVRVGGNDLSADGAPQNSANLRFGRALAVADFDGDGRLDLASLGSVNNSLLGGTHVAKSQVAVAIHLGRPSAPVFASAPDAYVLPANLADSGEGTFRLLVGPPVADSGPARLVVLADQLDAPDLSASGGTKGGGNAGGAYVFDLAGLGMAAGTPRQLGRDDALAQLWGPQGGMAAGRSAAVLDVDGDDALELVLGAPGAGDSRQVDGKDTNVPLTGKLLVYPYAELTTGTRLNQPRDQRAGEHAADTLGAAVGAWPRPEGVGLVALASRASTELGSFTGRLDVFGGAGALDTYALSSAALPARVASEQQGAAVALAEVDGALCAVVGAPGYSGPGKGADGNELGAGQALLYTPAGHGAAARVMHEGAGASYASHGVTAYGGRRAGSDLTFTDFDGDGRLDIVVGAPELATPTAANTEYAQLPPACITSAAQGNGGAIIQRAQADGSFVPAFRVVPTAPIAGCTPADAAACKRSGLGRGLAGGFDFDGDGLGDLASTRANGLEVFTGRAPTDTSLAKPTLVCEPAFSLPALAQATSAPAALGDLDADGCDEVAVRYAKDSSSGLLVAFGFDASGKRCRSHRAAAWIRLSGDAEVGRPNLQLGLSAAPVGHLYGDARAIVAVGAGLFPFEGVGQPAVLLYEAAALGALRPDAGERVVDALDPALSPQALVPGTRATGFGSALGGGADLDGDGIHDLVVAAPMASWGSDGSGAVLVFRGGTALAGSVEPWLVAVGDDAERANFGVDVSLAGSSVGPALLIGAPLSYRTGTANGSAFLLRFDDAP